jgi:hypothetical protein
MHSCLYISFSLHYALLPVSKLWPLYVPAICTLFFALCTPVCSCNMHSYLLRYCPLAYTCTMHSFLHYLLLVVPKLRPPVCTCFFSLHYALLPVPAACTLSYTLYNPACAFNMHSFLCTMCSCLYLHHAFFSIHYRLLPVPKLCTMHSYLHLHYALLYVPALCIYAYTCSSHLAITSTVLSCLS